MRISKLVGAVGGLVLAASIALAAGIYTNNLPYLIGNPLYNGFSTQAPTSLSGGAYTGQEGVPVDTNLPGGASPQTAALTIYNLLVGTSSNAAGTTSLTAPVAGVCAGGKQTFVMTPTATATITTPTAALCIANLPVGTGTPGLTTSPVGYTWLLKIVNNATLASTFVATLTGGSNVTITGVAAVQPASSNEYSCVVATATTITCTYMGAGL